MIDADPDKDEEEGEGEQVTIHAPRRAVELWRVGVNVARRRARDAWELDAIVHEIQGLRRGMRKLQGGALAAFSEVEGWGRLAPLRLTPTAGSGWG